MANQRNPHVKVFADDGHHVRDPGASRQLDGALMDPGAARSDRLLTITEVADYLAVPLATLYQWRHKGTGPQGLRVGRHVRYRPREIEAWLDALATAARRPSSRPRGRT